MPIELAAIAPPNRCAEHRHPPGVADRLRARPFADPPSDASDPRDADAVPISQPNAHCDEAAEGRRCFKLSREDHRSAVGDDDCVLDMRAERAISGLYRPAVAALANRAAAARNDRLDGDHQTVGQLL